VHIETDVTIVGSGFAGSITAMALRARGQRVLLLERGRHPRFAIGESTTPLTNLLLEELADTYDLPHLRPFSKWGTWQQHRPDVAVGLKRGFTFAFHDPSGQRPVTSRADRELLVAASPNDRVADVHWYRPDFDAALVDYAREAGADYVDMARVDAVHEDADGMRLEATAGRRRLTVRSSFVIDASGPRGCLVSRLGDGGVTPTWMPPTQGLYAHFTDVGFWDDIVGPEVSQPYPRDAAALHHVFPGGWIWVLRFNNGITSAGAALTDPVAARIGIADKTPAWQRLLDELPDVADHFRHSRATLPFIHAPRITFRTRTVAGVNWALLPSAAGVVDPLLSTGFPLTLLGIGRLVEILVSTNAGPERQTALAAYARTTQAELDATERLVAALYRAMADPGLFGKLALLYFAAASFSETVRRLGRPELAPGFLLSAHPTFAADLVAITKAACLPDDRGNRQALFSHIDRVIEPFDTAGLLDQARDGWYPVLADDLITGAGKLAASREDVERLLARVFLS
jgi:FADH2 O2-dependent halogenase